MASPSGPDRPTLVLVVTGLALLVLALFGTYWDDAWHTDHGRDTFWSPPHLAIYGGVGLAGAVTAVWGLRALVQTRSLPKALQNRALLITGAGALVTLAAAPIDDWWHVAFGRDAVLWSPPHMMGLVGVLAFTSGLALELRRSKAPLARGAAVFASAALLAGFTTLVFEYDSDVPQFPEFWYLPVLTGASAVAFAMGRILQRDHPWSAARAAAIHLALMVGVVAALALMDHSTPIVPALLVPALALDLVRRRLRGRSAHAAVFTVALAATYAAYLPLTGPGVRVPAIDIVAGLPLSFALARAAFALPRQRGRRARVPVAALAALALVALAPLAAAHDPGQGEVRAPVLLMAEPDGDVVTMRAHVTDPQACSAMQPRAVVARRAGDVLLSGLEDRGGCRFEGAVRLPVDGRWFLYVEFLEDGRVLEAWLPFVAGEDGPRGKATELYEPPSSANVAKRNVAGATLYAFNASALGVVLALYRRADAGPA